MAAGSWIALLKRVRAMHMLWHANTSDLTVEQVNHHERIGVLPITFSLFHYVNGEDRSVSERLLDAPSIWNADWSARTGIASDPIRRGTPIEIAEQVRITDMSAWLAYQSAVFERTEQVLATLAAGRWDDVVFDRVPDAFKGGFIGYLAGDDPILLGDLMDALLYQHGMRHLGEIEHGRSLVGLQGNG